MTTYELDQHTPGEYLAMVKVIEDLPELMAEFRAKHHFSQEEAATAAGMSTISWQLVENSPFTPSVVEILPVLRLFGTYKEHH